MSQAYDCTANGGIPWSWGNIGDPDRGFGEWLHVKHIISQRSMFTVMLVIFLSSSISSGLYDFGWRRLRRALPGVEGMEIRRRLFGAR
jgi:hypothetical protein